MATHEPEDDKSHETTAQSSEYPWRDKELLDHLFNELDLSREEIADRLGCSSKTVGSWLYRLNIIEGPAGLQERPATPAYFYTNNEGYERWQALYRYGIEDNVVVHRLLAVCEWGLDALRGKEVHHENGIPWDNRIENLQLVTTKEHNEIHKAEKLPKSELIEDLRAGAVVLGRPPKSAEYTAFSEHSLPTLHDRFGSWENALEAAGLDDDPSQAEIEQLYFEEGDE